MLLVQLEVQVRRTKQYDFNTLYVVGSISLDKDTIYVLANFNTLYVVGSKKAIENKDLNSLFQYIICCWFK